VAALKAMADRLGLVALIDRQLPASRRPLSMGTTLVLAAINRAVWPCSTRAWAVWAPRTSLPHLLALRPEALTSPYVWDQRDAVSGIAWEAIEAALTRPVVHDVQRQRDPLVDDPANVVTSLASGTARSTWAQRGHSQQTRFELRPCSLALVVARDGQIPLSADIDAGHTVDARRFPDARTASRPRLERVVGPFEDLTLVYDHGHHSQPHQAVVDQLPGP
jgi:hypothetical protein